MNSESNICFNELGRIILPLLTQFTEIPHQYVRMNLHILYSKIGYNITDQIHRGKRDVKTNIYILWTKHHVMNHIHTLQY